MLLAYEPSQNLFLDFFKYTFEHFSQYVAFCKEKLKKEPKEAIKINECYQTVLLLAIKLLQLKKLPLELKDDLKEIAGILENVMPAITAHERLYYAFAALVDIIEQVLDDDFMEFMGCCDYEEFDIVAYGKGVEQAKKDMA